MNIFQLKDRIRFESKRWTAVATVCFIALPMLLMILMMHKSSDNLNGNPEFAEPIDLRNVGSPSNSASETKPFSEATAAESIKNSNSGFRISQYSAMPAKDLLHGLLSTEFDDTTCVSRYQSLKPASHKPSPYLVSKLREYERLHKLCGPNTDSYNETLLQIKSGRKSSDTRCKYIVWIPANGLGNRIVSMVSSFIYAILTNRILLVDHGKDMSGLFCEPFPNTSWLLPEDFPLRYQFGQKKLRFQHSIATWIESINATDPINASTESLPPYLYLNINYGRYVADLKHFYCDQTQAQIQDIPWLILLSDQYFAPSFFLMPSIKQEMTKLFPEKDKVFHLLARYLLHPSNEAWGLITRFYYTYLAHADERIGVQVRVFNTMTTPLQTVMDQILACNDKESMLPKLDQTKSVSYPLRNSTTKAILVTSLYSKFYDSISSMYWKYPTSSGELVEVYQPSHDKYQRFGDNIHNMKAWAEINLLSLCDVLVTSAWSTFGYAAQGIGALKPWMLYKTDSSQVPDPPCSRDLSTEPCFHFPPTLDCNSKKMDAGHALPFIRNCLDADWGVKLVSENDYS